MSCRFLLSPIGSLLPVGRLATAVRFQFRIAACPPRGLRLDLADHPIIDLWYLFADFT